MRLLLSMLVSDRDLLMLVPLLKARQFRARPGRTVNLCKACQCSRHLWAGLGLALAWLWLDLAGFLLGFWLDLGAGFGADFSFSLDSRMHKNLNFCSFSHFYHMFTSFAVLIRSETTSGQVPGWVESHVHPLRSQMFDFTVARALYIFFLACALCASFLGSRTLPLLGLPRTSYDLLGPPRTS